MDFHDFPRLHGKSGVHHREVPKLCAGLVACLLRDVAERGDDIPEREQAAVDGAALLQAPADLEKQRLERVHKTRVDAIKNV